MKETTNVCTVRPESALACGDAIFDKRISAIVRASRTHGKFRETHTLLSQLFTIMLTLAWPHNKLTVHFQHYDTASYCTELLHRAAGILTSAKETAASIRPEAGGLTVSVVMRLTSATIL